MRVEWSNGRKPGADVRSPTVTCFTNQSALDDGQAPPPTDFARILDQVLEALDVSNLLGTVPLPVDDVT